jgi:hypothetical protein
VEGSGYDLFFKLLSKWFPAGNEEDHEKVQSRIISEMKYALGVMDRWTDRQT